MMYIFKFTVVPIYYLISRIFFAIIHALVFCILFIWFMRVKEFMKFKKRDIDDFLYLQTNFFHDSRDRIGYKSVKDFINGKKSSW